jgi:hypothetical protein
MRRLAHVGLTRARRRARISFVANRRIHGSWSASLPSRFIDELPEPHVEVAEGKGFGGFGGYGNYGSRFDTMQSFSSNYGTPGWRRAQKNRERGGFEEGDSEFSEVRPRGFRGGFDEKGQNFDEGSPSPLRGSPGGGWIRTRPAWQPWKRQAAAHHRRRTSRALNRHGFAVPPRRPRVSPEIRQRRSFGRGRQQAHHPVRQSRRKTRGG